MQWEKGKDVEWGEKVRRILRNAGKTGQNPNSSLLGVSGGHVREGARDGKGEGTKTKKKRDLSKKGKGPKKTKSKLRKRGTITKRVKQGGGEGGGVTKRVE